MATSSTVAATITADLVTRCLQYCKLEEIADNPDERALFIDFMAGAASYLAKNNIPEDDPQYRLILFGMTLHDYEHRDDVQSIQAYPANIRLKSDQLKQANFNYG